MGCIIYMLIRWYLIFLHRPLSSFDSVLRQMMLSEKLQRSPQGHYKALASSLLCTSLLCTFLYNHPVLITAPQYRARSKACFIQPYLSLHSAQSIQRGLFKWAYMHGNAALKLSPRDIFHLQFFNLPPFVINRCHTWKIYSLVEENDFLFVVCIPCALVCDRTSFI